MERFKRRSVVRSPTLGAFSYSTIDGFWLQPREDLIIFGGPSFLAVVWFGSTPVPSPLSVQQIVSLSQAWGFMCVAGRANWRESGRGGERGAESYDRKKAGPL